MIQGSEYVGVISTPKKDKRENQVLTLKNSQFFKRDHPEPELHMKFCTGQN